jgi:hypothetical protein
MALSCSRNFSAGVLRFPNRNDMEWDLLESVVRVYTVRINLVFVTWITTLVYDNFGVMCIRSCTVVNRAMPYSGRVPRRRTTVGYGIRKIIGE